MSKMNLKYSNIVVGDLNGIINKSKDIKIPSLSKFMAENNLNDMFDRKSAKNKWHQQFFTMLHLKI